LSKEDCHHATLSTARLHTLGKQPAAFVHSDEEDDKDEEAAVLAAELDESMSRVGSEWSLLSLVDDKSEQDSLEHELRMVSGRANMRVLVERAKTTARENRAKASAFVDRRIHKANAARDDLEGRREHALAVIRRAAHLKKQSMASRAAAMRGKVAAKVLGARDKAAEARRARRQRRAQARAAMKTANSAPDGTNPSPFPTVHFETAPTQVINAFDYVPPPPPTNAESSFDTSEEEEENDSEESWQSALEVATEVTTVATMEVDVVCAEVSAAVSVADVEVSDTTPAESVADEATTPPSLPPPPSSAHLLPRERWGEVTEAALVRGPTYFEDGQKVEAAGGPLCALFACQAFELKGEHLAGASATMLATGTLMPPPTAKCVLTIHFMCPRPSRAAPNTNVMAHFYADEAPADVTGPAGDLLRELWHGDAASAISRMKILAALRSGPALVRHTMSWMGLDETRPMLMCRQLGASINRATIAHHGGGGTTFEHVEIAFDAAASPLCAQMYKYAWPSLPSVVVELTLMLEARVPEHLPERPLARFKIGGMQHAEISTQPSDWPTEESQIPGKCLGSYRTARGAAEVGSWQSTRELISKAKPAKKSFFG